MVKMCDVYKTADWKTEKHVPVIECPDEVPADQMFQIKASLGKEIAHPNTTEHHIRWIKLYFMGEGDKFVYELGHFEFNAHGESVEGANQGPCYTNHSVVAEVKLKKPGTILASAYCNIHGLWENQKAIAVK